MTKRELATYAKEGIVKGIFWSIGVSLGFALVSTILLIVLSGVNTIPIIGDFVAAVVEQTQVSLESR